MNPERSLAAKLLILLSVCLVALAMPISFTGPAVALLAIGGALGDDPVALNWVTNAFMLAFGSTLLVTGVLADRFGRKRIFLTGTVLFVASALGLAAAPDIVTFDLLRVLQGIAAAASFSGGTAAMAQEFQGAARTRAFSLLGTTFGIGLSFGPVLSGFLVDHQGWRSVPLAIAAIAAMALACGALCLKESRNSAAHPLDVRGALAFTASLAALTFGVLEAPERGWFSTTVVVALLAAVIIGALFVAIERKARHPLLDLSLFRYPRFVGVQFLAAAPAYSFVVLLILLPIRFTGIEGFDPVETGWLMMALSGPLLVMPVVAALLTRWFSAGAISGFGLLIAACGLIGLAYCPPGSGNAIAWSMAVIGLGVGLPWGLMDGLAVSVVPVERAGMATGIFGTTRVAGEGIALAIVSAVLAALTQAALRDTAGGSEIARAAAAHRIATGDLVGASRLLPESRHALLIESYGDAFHLLALALAAMTVVSAIIVFGFLSHRRQAQAVCPAGE
jgi:MFS family permease